ncbi:MAG: hypothetical protein MRY32_00695, partial [Rickettsiales bacterium]|nr:hypothetical protein [Rickettsiales bacterium]
MSEFTQSNKPNRFHAYDKAWAQELRHFNQANQIYETNGGADGVTGFIVNKKREIDDEKGQKSDTDSGFPKDYTTRSVNGQRVDGKGDEVSLSIKQEQNKEPERVKKYLSDNEKEDQRNPSAATTIVSHWDTLADHVRHATPAIIVNNGARLVFGMRAIADAMSIKSGWQYQSPLRAAASSISLAGLCMGLVFTEKPVSEEERESYKDMSAWEYIPLRLKHALNPMDHVTSTVGLATIPNGVLMAMSGMRQHVPGKVPWELIQGCMTVAAGSALNFLPDQERAMQLAHGIFTIRAPFAYAQADRAWRRGIPEKGIPAGDTGQMGKFFFNQLSNVGGFFYTGVIKRPDGTIVTLEEAQAEKQAKAKQDSTERNEQIEKIAEQIREERSGAESKQDKVHR